MNIQPGKITLVAIHSSAEQLRQRIALGLRKADIQTESGDPREIGNEISATVLVCARLSDDLNSLAARFRHSGRVVVVGTADCDITAETVRGFLEVGVSDIILDKSCDIVLELSARLQRWIEIDRLLGNPSLTEKIIGHSRRWRDLIRRVAEVAYYTEDSILLYGETGTGKELLAQLVHNIRQARREGKYFILDCTTIAPELSGSEFFGHERGAFTGAYSARDGAFASADGGTLFLDEISELPLPLQAQLLRVIQEGTFRRVGSNVWHSTKFRLVCATNRDLSEQVARGRFRHDLYYRIAQWTFRLPPLRERPEDIIPLASHFLEKAADGDSKVRFDPLVEALLRKRSYPGNIRELKQLMARFRLMANNSNVITVGCVPLEEWYATANTTAPVQNDDSFVKSALSKSYGLDDIVDLARQEAIRQVVVEEFASVGFNPAKRAIVLKKTAERLKCSLRWIQKCSKELKIMDSLLPPKV